MRNNNTRPPGHPNIEYNEIINVNNVITQQNIRNLEQNQLRVANVCFVKQKKTKIEKHVTGPLCVFVLQLCIGWQRT